MTISTISYILYKDFVRFMHDKLFYNNFYVRGRENIPNDDTPTIIACNHQNCANDPIAIVLSLPRQEHPYVFARGSVFHKNKFVDKFFNWLGMIPIFRLNFDGEQSLSQNENSFKDAETKLLNGHKLIIFPEAGHMHGHFLGNFSLGYSRFAFSVAKNCNFEKDIQILPCCNHYSSYKGRGNDLIIQYGKPISLQPFYELYKIRPRTAQRAVNLLVRDAIKKMMLDIDDVTNYESIDFIRESEIGDIFAKLIDKNYLYFPDKKESDKQLVSILNEYKETNPQKIEQIYLTSNQIKEKEKAINITENQMKSPPSWTKFIFKLLGTIILLPVYLYSVLQCGLLYALPYALIKKDKMFFNSIFFVVSTVILGPLFLILSSLLIKEAAAWQVAILWGVTFPISFIFLSKCRNMIIYRWREWRYLIHPHKVKEIKMIRSKWIGETLCLLSKSI